jgi:hypothetical protein
MKKIMIISLAVLFLSGATVVFAKNESNKPLKVSDLKLNKKQVISKSQRDLIEKNFKASKGGHGKPTPAPEEPSATGILGAVLPDGAKKHAVVIGLSNYVGTSNDLCVNKTASPTDDLCADGDSLHMKAALNDLYNFDDVHIFRDSDAAFDEIQQTVEDITSHAGSNDEIVFFFSGHSTSGKLFLKGKKPETHLGLALYGVSTDSSEIIWDYQLEQWFSGMDSQRVVYIFDTCHAGALESYLKTPGHEVVMSSTADQYSYTFSLGGQFGAPGEGLFAHYFVVEGMLNNKADAFNDLEKSNDNAAVEESYSYAKSIISATQLPVLNDQFVNDLVLGR